MFVYEVLFPRLVLILFVVWPLAVSILPRTLQVKRGAVQDRQTSAIILLEPIQRTADVVWRPGALWPHPAAFRLPLCQAYPSLTENATRFKSIRNIFGVRVTRN